jgi:hypothetical protein
VSTLEGELEAIDQQLAVIMSITDQQGRVS